MADSAFSFWAIEPKRKRGIGGIGGEGELNPKEKMSRATSFEKKLILKSFSIENLTKI